tara:strand:+ start:778 stop:942 length:165 start_codon:yes stop_codon:yes gene_type:complete
VVSTSPIPSFNQTDSADGFHKKVIHRRHRKDYEALHLTEVKVGGYVSEDDIKQL